MQYSSRLIAISIALAASLGSLYAQTDSAGPLNMDAIYNRPFLTSGESAVAIGGYIEMNTQQSSTQGIASPFAFQMRRTTLFASSTIAPRIKFLLELEFENGVEEINLEFTSVDIEFDRLLTLRAGIVMNPIGAFNQNHDGPRWEFVDRPLSATTIIPSTLSNVGMGLHGKRSTGDWVFGYEAYLTNGFNDRVIDNNQGRTSLAAAKAEPTRFIQNPSGSAMFTGKVAVRNRSVGEIGLSAMTGAYNSSVIDGISIDASRGVTVLALDANASFLDDRLRVQGEIVRVNVDLPGNYIQAYGSQQFGGYLDVIATLFTMKMFNWDQARLNFSLRGEYVDYNQDKFRETGGSIGDEIWSFTAGLALRPVGSTIVRLNYRYQEQTDLLGNPPAASAFIQFGISTYF